MGTTAYGDISPRTAAFAVKDLLKRGMPYLILEKFGQSKPLPSNSSKTIKFRRYFLDTTLSSGYTPLEYFQDDATNAFDPTTKTLSEGTTPTATALEHKDIEATLVQYGDLVTITDIIKDTHEDNVLKEAIEILGEQAAIIVEKTRFNVLKAGSNVVYSNGAARSSVNTKFSAAVQRLATRTLKRQLAKPITSVVRSTPAYGTESISPSFVAVCHPDLEYDIRALTAFVPAEKYGAMSPWEGEIGKVADCRYILSTIIQPWDGVGTCGATGGTNVIENASSQAHVYPILYMARDAFGMVALKGKDAIIPMVVNPTPSDSDPLAQRGHVSWKALTTTIILNDAWMVRAEVACTDDDSLS
jgi:N4-gp56 family major capsid protein